MYVAEQTACEWVEVLTLKKDVVCARPAEELIEKVIKQEKDFWTDKEGFANPFFSPTLWANMMLVSSNQFQFQGFRENNNPLPTLFLDKSEKKHSLS